MPLDEAGPRARIGEKFTAGRALSRSLSLWSRNVVPFLGAGLLAQFPLVLVTALRRPLPTARAHLLVTLVQYVVLCLVTGTITHSVLEQLRGRHPGRMASRAAGTNLTWKLFAALVPTVLFTAAAGLFLVVPGVVCFVRWCLVPPLVVAEGGGDPRARSSRMTEGHSWAIFGLLLILFAAPLLLGALVIALGLGGGLPGYLLAVVLPVGILLSLGAVLLAVSYHLLRSEKEGDPGVVEVFR
jgi:hypothetical protein